MSLARSWTVPGCQRGSQRRDLPVAKELLLSVEGEVQDCEQRTLTQVELKGGDCVGIRFAHVVLGGAARAGLYVGRACLDHSRLEPCMYVCMYVSVCVCAEQEPTAI